MDPDGYVLVETTDALALVTLDAETMRKARVAYPGYLPMRARLYADAWGEIADAGRRGAYSVSVKRPWASSCGEPPWRR